MNINEKVKACLKLAELSFALPPEELEKLLALVGARKALHGALYGATLNRKTGATENKIKSDLRENAQTIKDWSSAPTETATDEHEPPDSFML